MNIYNVIEGNTGVLELSDRKGKKTVYQPDCDLDKTRSLLYEFYSARTVSGKRIKNIFVLGEIDWFPTGISMLYWQFFFQYIKYKPLIEDYLQGKSLFKFESPGRFKKLLSVFEQTEQGKNYGSSLLKQIYHTLVQFRNKIIVNKDGDILFYRYGLHDFRTSEIIKDLSEKYRITQVVGASTKEIFKNFLNGNLYFFTLSPYKKTELTNVSFPESTSVLFKAALNYLKFVISSNIQGYPCHARNMSGKSYRLFAGIDDANYVYPFLYSVQDRKIKTLGIQHGGYERRNEAYILKLIKRYRWYDQVIVWGDYWKNVILKHSTLFSNDFHLVAGNKHTYDYSILPKNSSDKTILIPYEFLCDSITIGWYIKQFIKKGFKVFFKVRTDESAEDQLDAYYLGRYKDQVVISNRISPEFMSQIDIIAGTQTTLLFDLLPYKKIIWILDTPLRLMNDMVDEGIARLFSKNDLGRIDEIYTEDLNRSSAFDYSQINGNKSISKVIEQYL